VTTTQVTLIQIDNYGPWTVTPEPRREMDLQSLQSRLFADIAQFMGPRDAYVFSTRYDNMIAVTNGLDGAAHAALQESIGNRYPVSVSLGTGVSERPIDALEAANRLLQTEGSAQDESRTEVLAGDYLTETAPSDLQIAHFDVVNVTGKYTDRLNEFDTFLNIERAYGSLTRYLRESHGALSFSSAATTSSPSVRTSPRGRSPTRSRTWPTTSTSNCRSASVAVPPPTRQDSRPNTRSKRAETTERASNCQSLRHSATERRGLRKSSFRRSRRIITPDNLVVTFL